MTVNCGLPQLQSIVGRRHPCHGAQADSHGPVQKTVEILLQYIDKVIDGVVQVQQIRALLWETVEIPQLQRRCQSMRLVLLVTLHLALCSFVVSRP